MKVFWLAAVAVIVAIGLLGVWLNHSLAARRDANCRAWEWVVQRASHPDDPKVIEFVDFMRSDLNCDIDLTP